MKNKKHLIWIYFAVSLVMIVTALIVALTAGINIGTDVGGGYQIEVKVSAETNNNEAVKDLKNALKAEKIRVERVFTEDKLIDTYVVAKTNNEIKDATALKTALATKLGVDAANIEINSFKGSVTNKAVIWTSVAIVCLLIGLFIIGWLRYGVTAAVSLALIPLHSLLIGVSLLIITRLPITLPAIIEVLAMVVLVVFATVLLLEKIRENQKLKHNENLSPNELVDLSNKETLKPIIVLAAMLLVFSLVMLCVPVFVVTMSALTMIVLILASVYSYYFMGISLHKVMLMLKSTKEKMRLSKNLPPKANKKK